MALYEPTGARKAKLQAFPNVGREQPAGGCDGCNHRTGKRRSKAVTNTPNRNRKRLITNRIAEIDRKFADLLRTVSIGNDRAHDAGLEALMKEKNDLRQRLQAMEQGSTQHDKRKENLTAILPILRNRPLPYDDALVRQTVKGIIADSKTKIRVVFPDGETVKESI